MRRNVRRKRALPSALLVACAVLLLSAAASAQTKISASYDPSGAIEVAAGDGPTGVASDGTNIWVTSQFGNSVVKIAPTGVVLGRFTVGKNPTGVASDGASVWVANNADDTVTKLSLDGTVIGTYAAGKGPQAILLVGGNALVANEDMTGRDGHHVPALPRDRVAALFRDGPG